MMQDSLWYSLIILAFYALGISLAILALWRARTPQGAIAWIIALSSFPFVTIPLFLVFGSSKFYKYVGKRKIIDKSAENAVSLIEKIYHEQTLMPPKYRKLESIIEKAHQFKFTSGNKVNVLKNGEQTYSEILNQIELAQDYILFQFYIFKSDQSGTKFKTALIKKAQSGIRVYFLYDQIGSSISRKFIREMKNAGVEVYSFKNKRSWNYKLQINFRNHRKLVVIDGKTVFVGGHNIGDEYLGLWRDTHVKIQGPAAVTSQISFLKDWYWASNKLPHLSWNTDINHPENISVCMLYTGPADHLETCELTHMSLVHMCRKRMIISTPYFVPSESFVNSLILSALRGCEIKIILPQKNDNLLIQAAEKVYIEKLLPFGIQFYQYHKGFLHQKVMLIDDDTCLIGSANLDSRSFFINFEMGAIIDSAPVALEVKNMLLEDLENSTLYEMEDLKKRNILQQIFARAANLLSPML